jgi:hypothetical protein
MTMLALMMAPRIPALVILFPFATGASSCGVDPSVDDILRYLSFAVQRWQQSRIADDLSC